MSSVYYKIINKNKPYFPILFCCDHANNFIPKKYNNLNLNHDLLTSHIAYDIGAKSIAIDLANHFKTSAILGKYSRLLVDLNRCPTHKDVICSESDEILIERNKNLIKSEVTNRIKKYHYPYHNKISKTLEHMDKKLKFKTSLICVHSFTPNLKEKKIRPWHIGLLYRDDKRLMKPILKYLKFNKNLNIGKNVPYSGYENVNYTMTKHGEKNKRPFISIEIRNDLIKNSNSFSYKQVLNSLIFAILNTY